MLKGYGYECVCVTVFRVVFIENVFYSHYRHVTSLKAGGVTGRSAAFTIRT